MLVTVRRWLQNTGLFLIGMIGIGLWAGAAWAGEAGKIVQAFGDARLKSAPAQAGDAVQPGDLLATGADGYLYIKTTDGGFLILRPSSQARVAVYHVDAARPANTRIKIELLGGVARSISGDAVKAARQNFRFNTPVAAIGVKGTDFTVFTDQHTTRVAVLSGSIVVSGFDAACTPQGVGPCAGPNGRELLAGGGGQVLQVSRDQAVPQLLRGSSYSPDHKAPARADEPGKDADKTSRLAPGIEPSLAPLRLAELGSQYVQPTPTPTPTPAPALVWGRWQALANSPADLDLTAAVQANRLLAMNSFYALLRSKDNVWLPPTQGVASFALQSAQAVSQVEGAGTVHPATLENGKLTLNFVNNSFATQFDLLSQGQRIPRKAEGHVFQDGTFGNPSQFWGNNNMMVQGAMAKAPALSAAYVFITRLDATPLAGQVASGVTHWGK